MSDNTGVEPPGGSGWKQLAVLAAAVCVGALLLSTPLAMLLVPGIFVVVAVTKLRGTMSGEIVAEGIDQDGAKPDETLSKPSAEPSTKDIGNGLLQRNSIEIATPAEVPPPQPSVNAPSRRNEILAGATSKPPPIPSVSQPQQHIQLPGAVPAADSPSLPAAPPIQLTPTRGLIPDTPPGAPKPAKEPEPKPAKPAEPPTADGDATSSSAPKGEATVTALDGAPASATGGAAILARLRQQRTDSGKPLTPPTDALPATAPATPDPSASAPAAPPSPAPPSKPPVTVLYGSQTGTCTEIARNLAAEAVERGFNATCASLNELGFAALSATRTPILIVISSSTGDGDPPDNAASFFVAMRRKPPPGAPPPPAPPLAGVRYTVLGLGDSNYTRFMHVPRAFKGRLAELGCREFYRCAEADEVEGVENVVDPWTEELWGALTVAVAQVAEGGYGVETVDGPAAKAPVPVAKASESKDVDAAAAIAAAAAAAAAAAETVAAAEREAAEAAAAKAAAEAAAKAAEEAAAAEAAAKAAADAAAAAKAAADIAAAAKAAAEAAEAKIEMAEEAVDAEAAARAAAEAEAAAKAAAETEAAAKAAAEAAEVEREAAAKAAAEAAEAAKAAAEAEAAAAAEAEAAAAAAAAIAAAAAAAAAAAEVDAFAAEAMPSSDASAPEAPPAADVTEVGAAATEEPLAEPQPELEAESSSLLPDSLVGVLESGVLPTSASVGLPTIAESRVFAEVSESALLAVEGEPSMALSVGAGVGGGEGITSLTSLLSAEGRPETGTSLASGGGADARGSSTTGRTGGRQHGSGALPGKASMEAKRRSVGEKPARLQAKPINVNFPKRDETVVKRKDEKVYGMLMGLAPVGVDTKGAPALLPCRLKLSWEKDEGRARSAREAETARPTREERHRVDPAGVYSPAQPFWSHISDARYETAYWSDRKVIHLELSVRGANMAYQPGDSIGVLATNHPDLVTNLAKRLHLSTEKVFSVAPAAGAGPAAASHIPSPCSVGYALGHCVDLTSVTRKSVLRLLAEHAVDAAERRTLMYLSSKSPGGKEAYGHEIGEHQPSLLDLLVRFRSVNPPFEALLDALPPLMPRMYSITSSRKDPARGASRLSVALSVVRFKTRYGTRLGVATTWLDRLAAPYTADSALLPEEPIYVPIFLRPTTDFKLPASLATPIIMIGPGTGVAPFRGFLQDRRADIQAQKPAPDALGDAVLFFGCRRDDEDYLYKEELEAFKADGTLAALHVAFSRAQEAKVYVQDLVKQQGEKVWALLQAGGQVYVCGDGAGMAKDVHATLAGIAQQYGGMNEAESAEFMQNLAQERRYLRDVWSA